MTKPQYFFFVDNDKYEWDKPTVTGADLRVLAAIPSGAQIFLKVPGKPDVPVIDSTSINLAEHHGPAKFSTQAVGSQAGRGDFAIVA